MTRLNKNVLMIQALALAGLFLITGFAFAASGGGSKIIPNGKVMIYNGDQKVGELTAEAPFPENKTLKVAGKCGVKMDSIYLVATDKSTFSALTKDPDKTLAVKQGKVFFGITAMPHPMTFITPQGTVTVQEVRIQAATANTLLKGYVFATDNGSEIGVIDGGSMIISTDKGEIKLDSGKRILLAQLESECAEDVQNYVNCPDGFCPEGEYCAQGTSGPECRACQPGVLPVPPPTIGAGTLALGAGIALAPVVLSEATKDDDNPSPK